MSLVTLVSNNAGLAAPAHALASALKKADAIMASAKEAGLMCEGWEAATLAGAPAAKKDCRQAVLLAATLTVGWEAAASHPSGGDCIFAAAVARTLLSAFAEGSGGGLVAPGSGTQRPLGCLLEGVAHPLQEEGGWQRCQAASGRVWTDAAAAAAASVTGDLAVPLIEVAERLEEIRDDAEICPEDRAYLAKIASGLRAVGDVRRRKALRDLAAAL